MRTVIYTRVSTASQTEGFGLDVQEQQCRSYADAHGLDVVGVAEEAGVSGIKEAHDRPALTDALLMLKEGAADVLLVARLDRLARQLTVQEAVLAEAWRYGAMVHAADYGEVLQDDPDDPMRTFVRQVMGSVAQLDRALLTKRMRDGRKAKKAQGGKAEGRYPFGWSKDGAVPAEQALVARVRELRTADMTWQEIAGALNGNGVSPRVAEAWTPRNLAKVMRSQ